MLKKKLGNIWGVAIKMFEGISLQSHPICAYEFKVKIRSIKLY